MAKSTFFPEGELQHMRKLASIQRITAIAPIPGADEIERADVLGWSVVVKKGEFQPGDLAVYFEIDSWLDSSNPAFATFEERFVNWGTKRGMRLKTIKLRKQISQGLLLKCSDFREFDGKNPCAYMEGEDVTELLNIEKWEPAEEASSNGPNKAAGAKMFPSFLRKTDQERVQNYVHVLPDYLDTTFEVSVKLDGSSMTVFHVGRDSPHFAHCIEDMEKRAMKRMGFWQKWLFKAKRLLGWEKQPEYISGLCSRNIELPIDGDNHFSQYVREHHLTEALANWCAHDTSFAVQGELIAPSIQGNYEKVDGYQFRVFDIFDIDKQKYLSPAEVQSHARGMELDTVPILYENFSLRSLLSGDPEETPRDLVESVLVMAEGAGMNAGVKREGLVFKDTGSEFSFKAISNSYLLKKEGK
jgi:RNA ligase (TIGR02306 family)